MKSFVYTVVAATIAAGSAAANSTDASTSGTVPAVDQSDYCHFTNVVDGTMSYVPGYKLSSNKQAAGYWATHRQEAATMTIKTRGAAVISVMGGDRVINRNDPSVVYPVKVDYLGAALENTFYGPEADQFGGWAHQSNASSVVIENLPGESDISMDEMYGPSWENYGHRRVFTTKEDPNYDVAGTPDWSSNASIKNPTAMTPENAPVQFNGEAYDQLNYHLRWTNYDNQPNLEYEFKLAIEGMAWMLGSDGQINYEDDGMGRTEPENAPGFDRGAKLSYYGMTDGSYYIEHTVQCLQ